jgi:hypothetical protein
MNYVIVPTLITAFCTLLYCMLQHCTVGCRTEVFIVILPLLSRSVDPLTESYFTCGLHLIGRRDVDIGSVT